MSLGFNLSKQPPATCVNCGHRTERYGQAREAWVPEYPGRPQPPTEASPQGSALITGPVCHWCRRGQYRCNSCGRPLAWVDQADSRCSFCLGYRQPRERDTQRQKVYRMEHQLFPEAYARSLTTVEAEALLKRLARRFATSVPRLRFHSGYGGGAWQRGGTIRIHSAAHRGVTAGTLVHEYAHHLAHALYPGARPAHNPEFVRTLLYLMRKLGYGPARPNLGRYRVKAAPAGELDKLLRARRRRHTGL